ncbi:MULTISPECIES: ATP-binding protein [unclassified Moorena]|uniref:ATP-binding protein n=1 Tax=unclassified Moorena TaxID=2683338 RepID=UPI0014001CB9|nr:MULTISPECIES: ATP-binding protein [unclassified Moorena]NEO16959.1 ATP-binding protein [Moorena sp. SIO3E8]NEQ03559.1 ATP-binding protein [Moorena sp. SIO3F7]
MTVNFGRFFRVCNPSKTLNVGRAEDQQYYIDFAKVRGSNIIRELRRTITFSEDEPTCQLFTGHMGCGKSTELSRLKRELEQQGFHVVYFESSNDLDLADVEISDILLTIARQVIQSLEQAKIKLQPTRFQSLVQGAAKLLNSEVTGLKVNVPEFGEIGLSSQEDESSLAFGIGEITTKAKNSKDIRSLLRQHLEPRVNNIVEAINTELIEPAQQQLQKQGKAGLVVIVDNLDRIHNKPKSGQRNQPEYLFVDQGEYLNQLKCHVVYTIPLILAFSNDQENLRNRFGSEHLLLPMVQVQEPDGSPSDAGIALLRQMILARAFPDVEPEQRLSLITKVFDTPQTLDRLCLVSGGHVRNLLVLLRNCLRKDEPPLSRNLVDSVISQRRNELSRAITPDEWELLRHVAEHKTVRGEEEYQILLKSLFVFEYCNGHGCWYDINPVLADAKELNGN